MNDVGSITKRQALLQLGMNIRHFDHLVTLGVIKISNISGKNRVLVDCYSIASLEEGNHYVKCLECGSFLAEVHAKHLDPCCGLTVLQYTQKHPQAPIRSALNIVSKRRSDALKRVQSAKMQEYYASPAGVDYRKSLSDTYQKTPARVKAIQGMVTRNQGNAFRALVSKQSKARWDDPQYRERRRESQAHLDLVESAANARRGISKTTSKPHRIFKEALQGLGFEGFESEYPLGYYLLDEAWEEAKVAIEVHGCYWHACPTCPGKKYLGNLPRDKSKATFLAKLGWRLLVVWEHEIKRDLAGCLSRVTHSIAGGVS